MLRKIKSMGKIKNMIWEMRIVSRRKTIWEKREMSKRKKLDFYVFEFKCLFSLVYINLYFFGNYLKISKTKIHTKITKNNK